MDHIIHSLEEGLDPLKVTDVFLMENDLTIHRCQVGPASGCEVVKDSYLFSALHQGLSDMRTNKTCSARH